MGASPKAASHPPRRATCPRAAAAVDKCGEASTAARGGKKQYPAAVGLAARAHDRSRRKSSEADDTEARQSLALFANMDAWTACFFRRR